MTTEVYKKKRKNQKDMKKGRQKEAYAIKMVYSATTNKCYTI